jgi:hypothetical protein
LITLEAEFAVEGEEILNQQISDDVAPAADQSVTNAFLGVLGVVAVV